MATPAPEYEPPVSKPLPKVKAEVTADEEKFDCPQPWYLALLTVAMSMMTSITVAGSLFFLLAAPEKVSPQCYERKNYIARGFCTASTVCFWTYPVVCCLFVVIIYAKNLVDQRTYYEFLLHRVVVGYGRVQAWKQPVVLALLVYALLAFSALVWYHYSQTEVMVSHVYSSLAYISPIISFLAVIFTSWSIQGKLITLPNFLEDYDWAVKHLNTCRCYKVEELMTAYNCLEFEMDQSMDDVDTPTVIALVEYYATHTVRNAPKGKTDDVEAGTAKANGLIAKTEAVLGEAEKDVAEAAMALMQKAEEAKNWLYWEIRLLFNMRLQDARSQSFRNWALAYMVAVMFAILLSVYVFICCLITCLEIERVLTMDLHIWQYTHYWSLRPDLGAQSQHKSLKQVAASVAMSAMQTGTRAMYNTYNNHPSGGLLHFQLGAAA